jgi:hypothetical protein
MSRGEVQELQTCARWRPVDLIQLAIERFRTDLPLLASLSELLSPRRQVEVSCLSSGQVDLVLADDIMRSKVGDQRSDRRIDLAIRVIEDATGVRSIETLFQAVDREVARKARSFDMVVAIGDDDPLATRLDSKAMLVEMLGELLLRGSTAQLGEVRANALSEGGFAGPLHDAPLA